MRVKERWDLTSCCPNSDSGGQQDLPPVENIYAIGTSKASKQAGPRWQCCTCNCSCSSRTYRWKIQTQRRARYVCQGAGSVVEALALCKNRGDRDCCLYAVCETDGGDESAEERAVEVGQAESSLEETHGACTRRLHCDASMFFVTDHSYTRMCWLKTPGRDA